MKFLQTYKRLDNLCRDMNGIGVTGYLEDMEQVPGGANIVPGWKEDYQQLKHYRYLRNQIVHEVNAEEEDLCSATDVAWLENFYGRILGTNDPLALYRKAKTTPSGLDPWLHYRMTATPHSAAGSQASYGKTAAPPAAEPPTASSPKNPQPSIYSPYSHKTKRPTSMHPASPPSTPRTGCALWLLLAFCIAMFFLSEFFR